MAKSSDWLPRRRDDVLAMARKWLGILPDKAEAWGVPQAKIQTLSSLTQTATEKLSKAKSYERTMGITVECNVAFTALEAGMRDIKKRYFIKTPLVDVDFVNLGLSLRDDVNSPVPVPVNRPGIDIISWLPHAIGLRYFAATDLGGEKSDYGVRVYYALVPIGDLAPVNNPTAIRISDDIYMLAAPPAVPEDLVNSFFSKRAEDILELPTKASGLVCYFAARYGNRKGKSGPWGDMIHVIVP
jgi:hypothetical protein